MNLNLPLEQQVSSLESSKRLCELGCPQESLFYWTGIKEIDKCGDGGALDFGSYKNCDYYISRNNFEEVSKWLLLNKVYSAYTVAELGVMLPSGHPTGKDTIQLIWTCTNMLGINQYADTEAEARSKMLIYLLENKMIEVK